jgi:hypothetical protein
MHCFEGVDSQMCKDMKVVFNEVDPLLEGTEMFTDSEGEQPIVHKSV